MENYIQVGQMALRSPDGEFLPHVPLFIREKDAGGRSEITGRSVAEELLNIDVARVFAGKYKEYTDSTKPKKRGRPKKQAAAQV